MPIFHREDEVERDLWDYLVQTSSSKGAITPGDPGLCPCEFWISPRLDTPPALMRIYCNFGSSSEQKKIVFLHLNGVLYISNLQPLPLVLSLKELGFVVFTAHFTRHNKHVDNSNQISPYSRCNKQVLNLFPQDGCSSPFAIFIEHTPVCPHHRQDQYWTQHFSVN